MAKDERATTSSAPVRARVNNHPSLVRCLFFELKRTYPLTLPMSANDRLAALSVGTASSVN
jgi:hypothetical protein